MDKFAFTWECTLSIASSTPRPESAWTSNKDEVFPSHLVHFPVKSGWTACPAAGCCGSRLWFSHPHSQLELLKNGVKQWFLSSLYRFLGGPGNCPWVSFLSNNKEQHVYIGSHIPNLGILETTGCQLRQCVHSWEESRFLQFLCEHFTVLGCERSGGQ